MNKDIATFQTRINNIVSQFQDGFGAVHYYSYETLPPIGGWDGPDQGEVAEHRIVKGEGSNLEEAFQNWRKELEALPQKGRAVYWRVKPEIYSDREFDTGQTRWQIFARLAIFV